MNTTDDCTDDALPIEPYPFYGPPRKTLVEELRERDERAAQGNWFPANGGTEEPFYTRTGVRLLYCWQPSTGRHAYLDMSTDLILTDDEARRALSTY